jgi:16S rRNA (cytidine1402-2'-O)-methyltransferase
MLGDTLPGQVLPQSNLQIINKLDTFIVEELRTARRFLIKCGYDKPIDDTRFFIVNEHTPDLEIPSIFDSAGNSDIGLLSEAGIPAVADPGAGVVREAYAREYKVVPLTGPSSLMLAMMASGLNGQSFAFNGYLPVKNPERNERIRTIEKRSETERQSQIFIETPYRNNQLIASLIETCRPNTRLCIAVNLTCENEWIMTRTIRDWKLTPPPDLKKQPAVFVLQG